VLGSQNPKRRREQFEAFLSGSRSALRRRGWNTRSGAAAHLERAGEAIGPLDTLIAATALSHGSVLVTRNLREFARVSGLKMVNWHD
jgi:tRNA(fMet)-specific endonuclease VapC